MSFVQRLNSFRRLNSVDVSHATYHVKPIGEHQFFFSADDVAVMKGSMARLGEMGGVHGLAAAFRTDLKTGLSKDEAADEYAIRRAVFGRNTFEKPAPASFVRLCWEALHDPMLVVLCIAGVVSVVAGLLHGHGGSDAIEGIAILLAVAVVTFVGAFNDWRKERQFRAMDDQKDEKETLVIRDGRDVLISTKEVNVGDLMILRAGSMIPADGVFITGDNVQTNEAKMTGENLNIRKNFVDPFVLSGTEVVDGEGVFLAVAVGRYSEWGIIMSKVVQARDPTPLQVKLEKMASQIGYLGAAVAVIIFVSQLVTAYLDDTTGIDSTVVLQVFILAVTIVVVAVPEGLPLAVTISLAYSMKKMVADNIFVRVLSACETMGNATQICSDKTGTLTKNSMTVTSVFLAGTNFRTKLPRADDLHPTVLKLASEGVALNSKAVVADKESNRMIGGNQTECAMLQWVLSSFETNYEFVRNELPLEKAWPFSSKTKRSSVLYKKPGDNGYRIYVKGASEKLLGQDDDDERSRALLKPDGSIESLTPAKRADVFTVITDMTKAGLRCIGMAYQDFDTIEYNEFNEVVDPALANLVFVGVCGIKDPVRDEVPAAVATCKRAGIVVRMVTGDHLETAKFISKECGILTGDPTEGAYLGDEFRMWTPEEAEQMIPRLRVLARSKPSDKEKLVTWLKAHGEVVAVTGDGTNDAPALSAANVGLSMGIQGTDVAKDASDIIIMDDNFTSIVKAIMWGRAVYDNIRKFVQFQLTVNVVALIIATVGSFTEFRTPLKAVQLLWVNLIMDSMAALALGTEMPTRHLLNRRPYMPDCSLVSTIMWRNIIGQSIYQLTVLLTVLFTDVFEEWTADTDHAKLLRLTTLFNAFVFMQIFNEVNSRKVNEEWNVLEKIDDNVVFASVMLVTVVMQVMMVELFGAFADTTGLTLQMWLFCVLVGLGSFPVGVLVRLVKVDPTHGMIASVDAPSVPAVGDAAAIKVAPEP